MIDILRTGMSGLLAFQQALATTGHNITNVNTPNYSRQQVDLTATLPQNLGNSYLGTGVNLAGISRSYDAFLTQQVRNYGASASQMETLNGLISQVSSLVGDADTGLAPALQKFFAAAQSVADTPTSVPARQVMLSQGESLATSFQDLDHQLSGLRDTVNQGLQGAVTNINDLATAIAAVNRNIALAPSGAGAAPNDLLDQRDKLLADLSQLVPVQTVAQPNGTLNVLIGNGQSLVVGNRANFLEVGRSALDPQDLAIHLQGQSADLSAQLTGGQVGGYLEFRRTVLNPAQDSLGLLAIGLAATVNAQHRQGMDLDGNLGGTLFQAGAPRVLADANNTGTATLTAAINDAGQLRGSDYAVSYDGANYTVQRLSDQAVVASGASGSFTVDGLTIALNSGTPKAGDHFLVQPTRQGAADFAVTVTEPSKIAAATPIRTSASQSNLGSASISAGKVLNVTDPNLRQAVAIRFTDPTTFDLIDTATHTTLAAGQTYTSGNPIAVNGWEVRISGIPQTGDSFQVTANAGGVGDNSNALALAGLQSSQTLLNGTSNYHSLYTQLIAEVGAHGNRAESTLKAQQALLEQTTQARDAASGVNLDEEAADLLRFQQAYAAAAQVIRVADSLFQTILDAAKG